LNRLSARQALRHPYFRDLRELEKRAYQAAAPQTNPSLTPSSILSHRHSDASMSLQESTTSIAMKSHQQQLDKSDRHDQKRM